ncbi:MAG: DUF58 domain-containing protein [Lentisphaeria bacterium]|nr:DUF58 domain-containing protein [Lentisphaeria bacterium]
MLETAELLKKVRKLEIVAGKLVEDVIGGAYHSVFKGRGIEFDEVREYTFEDDVRDIDWNVSARLNAPYVKKYVEERELTVLLMVDVSNSMQYGIGTPVCEKAVEAAALLGLSAINNHDRVGLSLFNDKIVKFMLPRNGRHNNLRLIRELLSAADGANPGKTDIASALQHACKVLKKRSVIFVISDLADDPEKLEKALKLARRRHDVIVLHTFDGSWFELPAAAGMFYDAENMTFIRLAGKNKKAFAEHQQKAISSRQELCRRSGVEVIKLESNSNTVLALMNFFNHRQRRRRGTA